MNADMDAQRPYAVLPDERWPGMASIRTLHGDALNLPRMTKPDAHRLCAALNEAFAWGEIGGDPASLHRLHRWAAPDAKPHSPA